MPAMSGNGAGDMISIAQWVEPAMQEIRAPNGRRLLMTGHGLAAQGDSWSADLDTYEVGTRFGPIAAKCTSEEATRAAYALLTGVAAELHGMERKEGGSP